MTTLSLTRSTRLSVLGAALILAGCASQQPAPIVDGTQAAATRQTPTPVAVAPSTGIAGKTYTVQPRDTLFQIARLNNVSVDDLRQWNQITDPNQLRIGQVLRLYSGSAVAAPSTAAGGLSGGAQVGAITESTPLIEQPPKAVTPPATTTTGSSSSTTPPAAVAAADEQRVVRAADANQVDWGWPASGRVIQGYTANTKGIDIEGQPGDPVVAAGAGQVMYSGNGVRGLGNLIIINHTGGFITAYAHNRALLVKTGDKVTRGQRIAELGQTDTTSPRLHFEVRRQGTPVDPLKYLPHR